MSEYWIQTFTGKRFDLLEPTKDMICIEDIAHHLSIENRFHGATKFAYSVGYHSVLGAQQSDVGFRLEFLFHDAHEAYYKDLSTHWKRAVNLNSNSGNFFSDVLFQFDRILSEKFNLYLLDCEDEIKEIDLRMCKTEKDQLMLEAFEWESHITNLIPYTTFEILKLQPENVEQLFLKEYEKWRRI